jgi:hypothetical protein
LKKLFFEFEKCVVHKSEPFARMFQLLEEYKFSTQTLAHIKHTAGEAAVADFFSGITFGNILLRKNFKKNSLRRFFRERKSISNVLVKFLHLFALKKLLFM